MKKLLLSLLISFFSFQGIAQDPQLFENDWYLQRVKMGLENHWPPNSITEPVTGTIEFDEIEDVVYISYCDGVAPMINYDPIENIFSLEDEPIILIGDCIEPENTDFALVYFSIFYEQSPHLAKNPFSYTITTRNSGVLDLIIENIEGHRAYYINDLSYPDQDLFQTWYLQDIYLESTPPLHLIEPPIYAELTISENLDFSGKGSCNTFTGTYEYSPYGEEMFAIEFNRTNDDCVFQYHNAFEAEYFQTIQWWSWHEITDDGTGLQLQIGQLFGAYAVFTNYPLSTPDFSLNKIKVYPNPSSSKIFIKSQEDPVTKVEIYNLPGKRIITINDNVESINISSLVSGIYLMKIFTEAGSTVKKIIKN